MHSFSIILVLLAACISKTNGAQRLMCRTSPKEAALAAQTYSSLDVIDLQCQTAGGPTVNGTVQWMRTADLCYVPSANMRLDADAQLRLPQCAALDGSAACALPNRAGFELLQRYEGLLAQPQGDVVTGKTFVGYGHACEQEECAGHVTRAEALVTLWRDVRNATDCLVQALSRAARGRAVLSDNMWAALTSWAFSLGDCARVEQSQLVARLVRGEPPSAVAAAELPRWSRIRGRTVASLAKRRSAELALFQTPSELIAHPRCDQIIA
ncbi:hypothetical protein GGI02_000682 [Coemansia sp. RSA 2322]|uniref:Lysozyme n=1 Tax=Coemansia thaxteri TaxID=2663907 RepID=A0A9W8BFE5_9FUNG|nr:hypothetical protein H4R26_003018 [Coemansia thaxteri]KAJ2473665.1 hypothetical protein GGI02_000682 [Coemansia sp. RSA 2322]KAJ2473769.1 hypothetical protein EV174_005674 [Coemansia sp. RSA 2320]